jgi:hypothetical protein
MDAFPFFFSVITIALSKRCCSASVIKYPADYAVISMSDAGARRIDS